MDWLAIFGNTLFEFIGNNAVIFAMAAIGINIHFGYTGLLNFGQVAWMAVGAYGMGLAATSLGLPMVVAVIIALVASVLFSLLMGIPTLRLRADYLAITTVAASAIVKQLLKHGDWAGGAQGLKDFPDTFTPGFVKDSTFAISFPGFKLTAIAAWFLLIGWLLVAGAALLVRVLMRSPWGRVLKSIREDELAAKSLGKNTFSYKMQSLIMGGLFGTVAGMLLVFWSQFVEPENFNPPITYLSWTALILGGIASPWGPVIGSMVFWALATLMESILLEAANAKVINFLDATQIGQIRYILVGLGLVLIMVLRPQGMFGNKKEMALDAR